MKAGIQYADGLSVEKICENGFREIELSIKNYDKIYCYNMYSHSLYLSLC